MKNINEVIRNIKWNIRSISIAMPWKTSWPFYTFWGMHSSLKKTAGPVGQQPTGKDVSLTATWIYPIEEPDVEDALFILKKLLDLQVNNLQEEMFPWRPHGITHMRSLMLCCGQCWKSGSVKDLNLLNPWIQILIRNLTDPDPDPLTVYFDQFLAKFEGI